MLLCLATSLPCWAAIGSTLVQRFLEEILLEALTTMPLPCPIEQGMYIIPPTA